MAGEFFRQGITPCAIQEVSYADPMNVFTNFEVADEVLELLEV